MRVGVPLEIGRRQFAPLVAEFVDLYPKIEAHLVLSDAILDVADDRLDLALYVGMPPEQGLVATKILSSGLVICAASTCLERHGKPEKPADLRDHNCLRLVRGPSRTRYRTFQMNGEPVELRVHGNLSTTSAEVVHDWALREKRSPSKPLWDIQGDIRAGRLVLCLEVYRDVVRT